MWRIPKPCWIQKCIWFCHPVKCSHQKSEFWQLVGENNEVGEYQNTGVCWSRKNDLAINRLVCVIVQPYNKGETIKLLYAFAFFIDTYRIVIVSVIIYRIPIYTNMTIGLFYQVTLSEFIVYVHIIGYYSEVCSL